MKHETTITMFLSPHLQLFIAFLFISTSILCFSPVLEAAAINDTLTTAHSLSSNQTLISSGRKFELGFFNRGNPRRYYLGIWYKDIPTKDILWVANRDSPSSTNSCTLELGTSGNLMILINGSLSNILWSSNKSTATNPVVQLLDSGNLVVREADDEDSDHYHWQSFDNPTDTLVPGQRLEWNPNLAVGRPFTSWRGPDDPGSGNFAYAAGNNSRLDFYLTRQRNEILYQTPIVQEWTHDPMVDSVDSAFFNYTYYYSPGEVYYILQQPPPPNAGVKLRIMVTYDGIVQEWMWNANPNTTRWYLLWSTGRCGCGAYGVCSTNGKVCECPHGFKPTDPEGWMVGNWSGGCARIDNLVCQSDRFVVLENVKVLQQKSTANFVNESMDLQQCGDMCKRDCNCVAYANSQVLNEGVGSTGCIAWIGNLAVTDVRNFTHGGQTLYVRVAASAFDHATKWTHLRIALLIVILTFIGTVLLAIAIWIRRYKIRKQTPNLEINEIKNVESLQFDLNTIKAATRNFSFENKLGEGGFGEVYKGKFEDGQEIAVKRLSQSSTQGALEFKTEILLVAKLQHKNLVKLLGFCLAPKEKILIYEYLRNSSLDQFLFDSTKKLSLDWHSRFKIMVGIARGLMYLHVDSRLKVIHRDLKTSNILLDENMNPKISDFGLAKLFEIDQTQDNTKRIVGTYGYMAPEYAMTGQFSVKSDVYSFGVIVLEIISGLKNRFSDWQQVGEALLHRAWRLWSEGKPLELVDTTLGNNYPEEEVIKCIRIGLMCVQEKALERPTIEIVVAALSGEAVTLPMPNAPNFFGSTSTSTEITHSGTDQTITITDMYPR